MIQKDLFKLGLVVSTGLWLLFSACEKKTEVTSIVQPELASYVGSQACQSCHSTIYDSFKKTGHFYELTPADSAQHADTILTPSWLVHHLVSIGIRFRM